MSLIAEASLAGTGLDSASLRALGQSLASDELIVFAVRHHSPGCAWQLQQLFASHPPSVVLVEGPRSFDPLLPLLVHPQAQMPLAIYTYAVGGAAADARRAAYYPFCDYSPELVALRAAAAQGIPARFIDLDFAEQCALEASPPEVELGQDSLLDEGHYRRSEHLQRLASQLGCRDHEELWEHLFEVPATRGDWSEHLTRVAAYCQLARLDCSHDELQADGTLAREAEMAWHIQQALAARRPGEGPVLVVVGGLHAVALPGLLATGVERPAISRAGLTDEASALIRYSFDRLERLNGYAAGMTAPAWHQRLWHAQLKHSQRSAQAPARPRQAAALELLFEVAEKLREQAVALPLPTLTAAYEQMLRLATLRGRDAPIRVDVDDAILSCFIQGDADADGVRVRQVARACFTGQALGRVPPGAGTPPLVKDVEYRARRQRLKLHDSQPRRVVLDLYRRAEHRRSSQLLHGLLLLGIPFAWRTGGPDFVGGHGLHLLQEHWEYAWTASTEGALVEASVYGATLPQAVASRFAQRLEQQAGDGVADARGAAALLVQACVLGLHEQLATPLQHLADAIGADPVFASLVAATASLSLLLESREPLQAAHLPGLPGLLRSAYQRATYLGAQGVSEAEALGHVACLVQLRELLAGAAGAELDQALYWALVSQLHQQPNLLLRGACAGLLYLAGHLSEAQLATELAGHLHGLRQPQEAVAYLRGLLSTARESAWQVPSLLEVLDPLLSQWGEAQFVACLPELRLAFAEMTPRETDRIATRVAQLHGANDLGRLRHASLQADQVQANLRLSQSLALVLQGDGLDPWMTP